MTRAMLKDAAKQQLQGKWATGVLATLIVMVLGGAVGAFTGIGNSLIMIASGENAPGMLLGGSAVSIIAWVAYLLVIPALSLGFCRMFLQMAKGQEVELKDLFWGFRYFLKALGLTVMVAIFTLLWTLLFVIPGIIAAYRYSQAFFLLAEDPEIGVMEAIRQSKQMMIGHKWEYFVLELSFIGWAILASFCLIGMLWLAPYMNVTYANYYLNLRREGGQSPAPAPAPAVGPEL